MTRAVLASLVLAVTAATARAEEARQQVRDWSISVTPYVWIAGLQGSVGVVNGRPPSKVDATFGDIFRSLDAGLMVVGDVRWKRFGMLADLLYLKMSEDASVPLFGTSLDTTVRVRQTVVTGLFYYRLVDMQPVEFDMGAGFRLWSIATRVSVSVPAGAGVQGSLTETWADPILGARFRFRMTDRLTFSIYGDVGGFGVGSRITAQAYGGAAFAVTKRLHLSAGYRVLTVNYRDGPFIYDTTTHGPILGFSLRF